MDTLQITVQRKLDDAWPIVVEQVRPGAGQGSFLPVRTEGVLRLDRVALTAQGSPREYGTFLGQALFRDRVRDAFAGARRESEDYLRVLLFVEADDLRSLRWERLCAPLDGGWDFLALDQRVPFSLYLPSQADRRFPPIGRLDLHSLIVAASPPGLKQYGLSHFNVRRAVSDVQAALGEIPSDVLANIEGAVGPPTLDALCERLTAGHYSLLHIICHGRYQRETGDTLLYLADAQNGVDAVTGTRLLERLGRLHGARGLPHFAFLATCESASPEAEGALGGLAQRLVRELGMPAALAMTEKVSVDTAQALAEAFYRRLCARHEGDAGDGEVDRALAEACAGLAERYDITVPALFSRLGSRPLFSDTDRLPSDVEIGRGLARMAALLGQRAPAWQTEFEVHARTLRATLGVELTALSPAARSERQAADDVIRNLCEETLDLSFDALALGQEPPAYDDRCPFRGMYPFRAEDRAFFFGREALVVCLAAHLAEDRFLAVLGPSGSGKSSLVLAGLLPALQQQEPGLQMRYMTPGSDPLGQLANALGGSSEVGDPRAVLVVDQFEQLFTLCTDESRRQAFLDRLLALIKGMPVVLTMRADFWGECAPYRALVTLMQAQELIAPMAAPELRSAMEQQAAAVGLRFEADLVNTILDAVTGEPGAMPLLQHALLELWKRRQGRWLRASAYRAIGGVQQAIARTADAVFGDLKPGEPARVRDIFMRLTRLDEEPLQGEEPRDTGRRVGFAQLVPAGEDPRLTRDLVKRLADAYLVVTGVNPATAVDEVEVAHEALIRYWPRLRAWLDEDHINYRLRESIGEDAAEWGRAGRPDDLLPRWNSKLAAASELSTRRPLFFNQLERDYLATCVLVRDREAAAELEAARKLAAEAEARREAQEARAREAEARTQDQIRAARKLRWLVVLLSILVVAACMFAALWNINATEARRQTRRAVGGELAAQSESLLAQYPQRSLLLAVEAVSATMSYHEPPVVDALQALYSALGTVGGTGLKGQIGGIDQATLSPDNHWLLTSTGNWDTSTLLWDLTAKYPAARRLDSEISGGASLGEIGEARFSPDSRWLATRTAGAALWLWDLRAGALASLSHLELPDAGMAEFGFSADSRWLVTRNEGHEVSLWDVNAEMPAAQPVKLSAPLIDRFALGPAGPVLATGDGKGAVTLWTLPGAASSGSPPDLQPKALPGPLGPISMLAFSHDERWLAAGRSDGTTTLWDLGRRGAPAQPLEIHGLTAPVSVIVFSHDGRWLVTGSGDPTNNTLGLWDLTAPDPNGQSLRLARMAGIDSVDVTADGHWLVAKENPVTFPTLWDLRAGDPFASPIPAGAGGQFPTYPIALSPEGKWLITGEDPVLRLWNLMAQAPLLRPVTLKGHEGPLGERTIRALAVSRDGRWLISGGDDGTARQWDLQAEAWTAQPARLSLSDAPLAISPGGRWIVANDRDKYPWLVNAEAEVSPTHRISLGGLQTECIARPSGQEPPILTFSSDGRWLATIDAGGTPDLWDLASLAPAAVPVTAPGYRAQAVGVSPDSRWLVVAGADGTLQLADLVTEPFAARPMSVAGRVPGPVCNVAIGPDRQWVATSNPSGDVQVWRLRASDPSAQYTYHVADGAKIRLVSSPDGRWLAGANDLFWTGNLWDLGTRDGAIRSYTLKGHVAGISRMVFSPDGRWLATTAWDPDVRLWDLKASDPSSHALVLRDHAGPVDVATFSPDGRWLATGSRSQAYLWNLASGDPATQRITLGSPPDSTEYPTISAAAFSKDAHWLVLADDTGAVLRWDLKVDELLDMACRAAGRNLTDAEWSNYFPAQPYRPVCGGLPEHPGTKGPQAVAR